MKMVFVSVVCTAVAFWVLYAINIRNSQPVPAVVDQGNKSASAFPDDMAAAAKGEAVPAAAAWKRVPDSAKVAALSVKGTLHDWHDKLQPEWQSESVEETELVMVLGDQQRMHVETQTFADGRLPIHHYRYHLSVWLLEAKTGTLLAKRQFFSQLVSNPSPESDGPIPCSAVTKWLYGTVQLAARSQPIAQAQVQPAATEAGAEPGKQTANGSDEP
jgi:hypothetical protein